ncbi:MAG: vitamin B12-dependent ribonucleotide reductase, partial [Planctomycetota bacterium]
TSKEGDAKQDAAESIAIAKPRRERLPDTRKSVTHKFSVAGHEGYITVGMFDDGRPGELFITMAKEGSTIGGLMDAFGTSVSMSLQYGVPLEDYVRKFSHMRFEPQGHTKNPDIRIAKSLIDYIFRWLGITFLPGYKEASQGQPIDAGPAAPSATGSPPTAEEPGETKPAAKKAGGQDAGTDASAATVATPAPTTGVATNGHVANGSNGHAAGGDAIAEISAKLLERAGAALSDSSSNAQNEQFAGFQADAPACDSCGAITVRNGNCYLCHNCGASMGCS